MKKFKESMKAFFAKVGAFFKKVGSFLNKYVWHYLRYVFVPIAKFFSWLFHFRAARSVISSIICVFIGIFVGFIVMLIRDPANCFAGLNVLLSSGFQGMSEGDFDAISHVIGTLTPMIPFPWLSNLVYLTLALQVN